MHGRQLVHEQLQVNGHMVLIVLNLGAHAPHQQNDSVNSCALETRDIFTPGRCKIQQGRLAG